MADDLHTARAIIAGGLLALLWLGEGVLPMVAGRKRRLEHAASNLTLGLLNAVASAGIGALAFVVAAEASYRSGFGLLHQFQAPWWLEFLLAAILFDAWHYLCHRACHHVPILWRLHAIHHSDREVDVSTAMRFHTLEIMLTTLANAVAVGLLGMSVPMALLYSVILIPATLFHHSNLHVPDRLDRILQWIIVTPRMHWVHHSQRQPETDSNFASVLSIWDHLFRTHRANPAPDAIPLGLLGYTDREWRTVPGMLASPLKERDYDSPPPDVDEADQARGAAPTLCSGPGGPSPRGGRGLRPS